MTVGSHIECLLKIHWNLHSDIVTLNTRRLCLSRTSGKVFSCWTDEPTWRPVVQGCSAPILLHTKTTVKSVFTLEFCFLSECLAVEKMRCSPHICSSAGGPGVVRRGGVEAPLLSIARLSEQSQTSVINPGPSQMGQWSNSSYHSLPWHLKPLGRGTPIFPCLCVRCHTKGAPVPWSFTLSLLVSTKEAGVKINFHPPSHQGRVANLYTNVVM